MFVLFVCLHRSTVLILLGQISIIPPQRPQFVLVMFLQSKQNHFNMRPNFLGKKWLAHLNRKTFFLLLGRDDKVAIVPDVSRNLQRSSDVRLTAAAAPVLDQQLQVSVYLKKSFFLLWVKHSSDITHLLTQPPDLSVAEGDEPSQLLDCFEVNTNIFCKHFWTINILPVVHSYLNDLILEK